MGPFINNAISLGLNATVNDYSRQAYIWAQGEKERQEQSMAQAML